MKISDDMRYKVRTMMPQYIILRETVLLNQSNEPISHTHTYYGPYNESEVECKYKEFFAARGLHEIIIKIELGKGYPI